jgi:hypothetical protein
MANINKQRAKLLKQFTKAEECLDRHTARKILRKADKIYHKLNKALGDNDDST